MDRQAGCRAATRAREAKLSRFHEVRVLFMFSPNMDSARLLLVNREDGCWLGWWFPLGSPQRPVRATCFGSFRTAWKSREKEQAKFLLVLSHSQGDEEQGRRASFRFEKLHVYCGLYPMWRCTFNFIFNIYLGWFIMNSSKRFT